LYRRKLIQPLVIFINASTLPEFWFYAKTVIFLLISARKVAVFTPFIFFVPMGCGYGVYAMFRGSTSTTQLMEVVTIWLRR
jgi:hypothetical protein